MPPDAAANPCLGKEQGPYKTCRLSPRRRDPIPLTSRQSALRPRPDKGLPALAAVPVVQAVQIAVRAARLQLKETDVATLLFVIVMGRRLLGPVGGPTEVWCLVAPP